MSKSDLYGTGATLIVACLAYFVGGTTAAIIAGSVGFLLIVLAHLRKSEEKTEPNTLSLPREVITPVKNQSNREKEIAAILANSDYKEERRTIKNADGSTTLELTMQRSIGGAPLPTPSKKQPEETESRLYLSNKRKKLHSEIRELEAQPEPPNISPFEQQQKEMMNRTVRLATLREIHHDKIEDKKKELKATDERLAELLELGPRPRISLHWVGNTQPALAGTPWQQRVLAFYNDGDRAAQSARIIPDKTKTSWLEQIGALDLIPPDKQTYQIFVRAKYKDANGIETNIPQALYDPVAKLLMRLQLGTPPISEYLVRFEYKDSQGEIYPGLCRIQLDDGGNVSCENLPPY
jgi:hypothetical protein